jgi:hypothetical protein
LVFAHSGVDHPFDDDLGRSHAIWFPGGICSPESIATRCCWHGMFSGLPDPALWSVSWTTCGRSRHALGASVLLRPTTGTLWVDRVYTLGALCSPIYLLASFGAWSIFPAPNLRSLDPSGSPPSLGDYRTLRLGHASRAVPVCVHSFSRLPLLTQLLSGRTDKPFGEP